MKMKRIRITSQSGHFGKVLGIDDRLTHDTPPPSTVVGILKLLFGEEIEDEEFTFGHTFSSATKYLDDLTIYKHTEYGYQRKTKESPVLTDCRSIENHSECELIIYTDLNKELRMERALCMGRSGNPARIRLPIASVRLENKEGKGYNQYTPISIGKGKISPIDLITTYNPDFNSYEGQVVPLRLNKEFNYDKNYDEELSHNIVLWKYKDGGVSHND